MGLSPDDDVLELPRDAPNALDRPPRLPAELFTAKTKHPLFGAQEIDYPSRNDSLALSNLIYTIITAMADDETRRETSRLWRVWKTTKQLCYDRVRQNSSNNLPHLYS